MLQSDHTSKTYFSSLIPFIDFHVEKKSGTLVVYLEAGHFNSRYGADEFSLSSLQDAIDFGLLVVKKYKRTVRLVYGVLVDDLGANCSGDVCTPTVVSRDHGTPEGLPPELEETIAANPLIKRDRVMVFSERTSKNRVIDSIRRKIKQGDASWIVESRGEQDEIKINPGGEFPFLMAKRQGSIFTAKCPAIIAQHYKDVTKRLQQRFPEVEDFLVVDWSETSDRINVTQGRSAMTYLSNMKENEAARIRVVNIFFADEKGHAVQISSDFDE